MKQKSAEDGEIALEKLRKGGFDLVLLDVMLPKMSGIEVCQAVREKKRRAYHHADGKGRGYGQDPGP